MRTGVGMAWCVIETPEVCSPGEPLAGFAGWARRFCRLGGGHRFGTDDQDGTRRQSNEPLSDRPEAGAIHSRAIVVSDDDEVGLDVLGQLGDHGGRAPLVHVSAHSCFSQRNRRCNPMESVSCCVGIFD